MDAEGACTLDDGAMRGGKPGTHAGEGGSPRRLMEERSDEKTRDGGESDVGGMWVPRVRGCGEGSRLRFSREEHGAEQAGEQLAGVPTEGARDRDCLPAASGDEVRKMGRCARMGPMTWSRVDHATCVRVKPAAGSDPDPTPSPAPAPTPTPTPTPTLEPLVPLGPRPSCPARKKG